MLWLVPIIVNHRIPSGSALEGIAQWAMFIFSGVLIAWGITHAVLND